MVAAPRGMLQRLRPRVPYVGAHVGADCAGELDALGTARDVFPGASTHLGGYIGRHVALQETLE